MLFIEGVIGFRVCVGTTFFLNSKKPGFSRKSSGLSGSMHSQGITATARDISSWFQAFQSSCLFIDIFVIDWTKDVASVIMVKAANYVACRGNRLLSRSFTNWSLERYNNCGGPAIDCSFQMALSWEKPAINLMNNRGKRARYDIAIADLPT